jgi:hypothetical protein
MSYWHVNPNRVAGGRDGKLGGHRFEKALALHNGLPEESVDGGNKTKIDIDGVPYGWKYERVSVKNSSGKNTQIFLTTQNSFLSSYDVPSNVRGFIDLFFGQIDSKELFRLCKRFGIDTHSLDQKMEIRRQRILASNIPEELVCAALDWLNSNRHEMFRLLFERGYPDWEGKVETLAWAWTKNEVGSVKYYPMEKLRELFLRSNWEVAPNGSTLWCMVDGKKLLHLQMKGSGQPKYVSWGYHSLMFHIHSTGLELIDLEE